jgi:hypothetical protein
MVQGTFPNQPSQEWVQGAKRRLEIATTTRFSNPPVTLQILIQIISELLERLSHETEERNNTV